MATLIDQGSQGQENETRSIKVARSKDSYIRILTHVMAPPYNQMKISSVIYLINMKPAEGHLSASQYQNPLYFDSSVSPPSTFVIQPQYVPLSYGPFLEPLVPPLQPQQQWGRVLFSARCTPQLPHHGLVFPFSSGYARVNLAPETRLYVWTSLTPPIALSSGPLVLRVLSGLKDPYLCLHQW